MGDRTVAGFWYCRPKKIYHLTHCHASIVLASGLSPVRNQDCGANEGFPALVSAVKSGWPVLLIGEEGSRATTLRAIMYTAQREALTVVLRFEGGGRVTKDVKTEKEGAERSRRACARVPRS